MTKFYYKGFTILELSVVLILVGMIIFGLIGSNVLVGVARKSAARMYTNSSPVLSIDDNQLWLESVGKDSLVKNGNKVVQWNDMGPRRNIALQDVLSDCPEFAEEAIGKVTSLRFSGAGDHLQIRQLYNKIENNFTVVIVFETPMTVGSSAQYMLDGVDTSDRFTFGYLETTRMFHIETPTSDLYSLSSYSTGKVFVVSIVVENGNNASLYVNKTLDVSGTLIGGSLNGLTIGSLYNSATDFNGDISEVIIYSRNLSDDEREEIEDYLIKKYKIKL